MLVALALALTLGTVTLVPWRVRRPSPAERSAALQDVPEAVANQGRALHAALRPSSYGGLLVGLAVPVLLGFTPAGARIVVWAGEPFGGHWLAQALVGGLVVLLL